jgi:hypothetical protein
MPFWPGQQAGVERCEPISAGSNAPLGTEGGRATGQTMRQVIDQSVKVPPPLQGGYSQSITATSPAAILPPSHLREGGMQGI